MFSELILTLHNLVRWVVIILGIVAAALAFAGWLNKRSWTERVRRIGSFFAMSVDIQILLGLLLYFIGPLKIAGALQDFGAAMGVSDLRFYALEHPLLMVLGVVFAHLGNALPRKVDDPQAKYKRAAVFFGLAVVLILIGTPWARRLLPF